MKRTDFYRKISLIAGFGYLVIFITGIFANFFTLERLVIDGDAGATLANISENAALFRLGILFFIIMVLFDLMLSWALYLLFNSINQPLSLFMAWFRLVNAAIFGVALFHLFDVLVLTGNEAYLVEVSTAYIHAELMRSLDAFNYTWLLGLLFFGVHLIALGILALQPGYIPKLIGYLLIIAGAGYLIDSMAQFMMNNYEDYQNIFTLIVVVPGVLGELSFTLWLLIKGGRSNFHDMESS
jgi:hypothetical protein